MIGVSRTSWANANPHSFAIKSIENGQNYWYMIIDFALVIYASLQCEFIQTFFWGMFLIPIIVTSKCSFFNSSCKVLLDRSWWQNACTKIHWPIQGWMYSMEKIDNPCFHNISIGISNFASFSLVSNGRFPSSLLRANNISLWFDPKSFNFIWESSLSRNRRVTT